MLKVATVGFRSHCIREAKAVFVRRVVVRIWGGLSSLRIKTVLYWLRFVFLPCEVS
jgi:hypothetical protein